MGEYILSVLCVAVLSGLCRVLSPEGGTKKYVGMIGSLCVISVMILSFNGGALAEEVFSGFDLTWESMDESELYKYYNASLRESGEKNTEERVKHMICENCNARSDDFDIDIHFKEEGEAFSVEAAVVTIYKEGIDTDPHIIREYIKKLMGVECSIVYDMKG